MITFGDGAEQVFAHLVGSIPHGYTVALLDDERQDPDEVLAAQLVAIHPGEGVVYRDLDDDGDPVGPCKVRPWASIARIHVY